MGPKQKRPKQKKPQQKMQHTNVDNIKNIITTELGKLKERFSETITLRLWILNFLLSNPAHLPTDLGISITVSDILFDIYHIRDKAIYYFGNNIEYYSQLPKLYSGNDLLFFGIKLSKVVNGSKHNEYLTIHPRPQYNNQIIDFNLKFHNNDYIQKTADQISSELKGLFEEVKKWIEGFKGSVNGWQIDIEDFNKKFNK
jgi:hypothetical protein